METVFTDITDYLLNQSWQIAILFAVVVIVCMAIRKKTAHLRYLLWLLIIAKCLVPSLITVSLAILPQKPLLQPLPESLPIREFAPPPETVIMSPGAPLSPPAPLAVRRRPSIMAQLAQIPPKTWFSGIWLGGVGLFLLIVLIKAARFNHRLKGQRKRLTAGMQKEMDELLDRFGVHAKLHIWLLDGIGQPFVWGLLRGSIYLPANFSQIGSREHRRGILMHEITHVARFDAAVNCLQAIAQAVFWFHPLVWWANRNIRAEREKCCDETAIARLSAAPKVYSSAIVDTLIAEYQSTLPVPSLAIAGPIKNIEDRIKTIMKPGKKFYNRPTIIAIVTILLLAIAAVPTTIALTHRQAKKPEEYLTKTDVQVGGEEAFDVEVLTTVIKVEDEQGNPVAGAVITPDGLRTKKEKGSSHYFWRKDRYGEPVTVKTNAQGKAKVAYPRYANEKLETGSVSFLINHPDFCTDRPFYNIDETDKPVVLKRGATLRVSGYLESKGDLLTGIYPQLGRGRLYSDSWQQSQEGVYETHQLPPGPHYIRLVYLPEDGPASFSEAVRFDAEKGETYEFNLQLKPGVRLEGTLDQSVPRPVRNGRVVAAAHPLNHPHHSKRPRKRFTDPSVDPGYLLWRMWCEVKENGTFVFESLPHGEVELIAICDGYISKNPPDEENMNIGIAQSWPLKEPVTVAKLKMKPTASCKIKVLDEHGKPVKGAQVGFSPNVQWHSGGAQIFATPLNTFDLLRAGGKLSPDKWLKISEVADFQAISDESGIAVVPNMPDGKRHFAVLHPQYQLPAKTGYAQFPRRVAEVELIAGQTAEVTVTMQKKGDDFLGAEDLDTRTSYKADIEIAKPFIQTCRPKYNPNAEDMQVLKGQKAGPSEISGIVTDQQGQPIEGVLVDVWTWYPGNETHTDKNGFFALKDFDPDQKTVEIRFSKAKYSPRYILRQPLGLKDTQVVLGDRTYFEGKVFDSNSKPVPNALIKAIAGPKDVEGGVLGEIPTVTTSGDDGSYRLYVQADTYDIQVKADKGVVRLPKVDIAKNEAKQLDFKLESSVTFKAKIVDSQTGKPVEGIRLFHWKHEDVDGTSNSDGLIEIIGMLPGKFEFWVEAEQCGRWWSQQCISKWNRRHIDDEETGWQRNFDGLDFDLSVGMEPVTIVTEKPVKINGKIVDPLGNPVAGATATLAKTGSGNSITGDTRYSFATDKNGKFEMIVPASKEAEYNLLAHDGEYDEWRKWANGVLRPIKTIPGDIINDIVIELGQPASVKGKVLDSSANPVPNNKVRSHAFDKLGNRYYDPTTRTDENGDFEIKFIRAGKHYIQAYPFWLTAEQAPGKTSNIVTLQQGQNLEGIELITNQPEKLSPLKVKDLKKSDVQVEGEASAVPVVSKIGSPSDGEEIIGKVIDAKDRGVSGAIVFLCDQSSGIPISKKTSRAFTEEFSQQNMNIVTVVTDDNGAFSFENIPNGQYRLVAQSWRDAEGFKGVFEVNGKAIELHGIAEHVQIPSDSSVSVVIRPLGTGVLQIDEKVPNNETLLVISTEPTQADPILGFAGWSGRFMQNMIGGNRMPSGKTTISGLPEGKIYLAMFASDSVPGWLDGEVYIQAKKTTVLNYIQFVNSWSNSRHTPPEHLLPLFEEMELLLAKDKAFLQKLFATHGVGFDASNMWEIQKQISQHLQKEIDLPSGTKASFGDIVAVIYYIELKKTMEQKREKAKKQSELIEKFEEKYSAKKDIAKKDQQKAEKPVDDSVPPHFFPNDPEVGKELDELWPIHRHAFGKMSKEEIFEIIRNGFSRTSMNKNDIIGFIGNKYIWKQSPSDQAAVDIMYYASFDPAVKQQAFYYGLTVAKPKTQKVLNRLVELAMEGYGVGRIAWGVQDQRDEFLDLLKPYLSSSDTIESQQAQNIARVIDGKNYLVYIYSTGKGETTPELIERAQKDFADKLDQIKQNLLTGTSSEKLSEVERILSQNIYLLLDDTFIPAVQTCAEDKNSQVRMQIAELAGCYWVWGNTTKNPRITQLLIQLSKDKVKEVRFAAVEKGLFNIPSKGENVIKRIIDITLSDKKNIPEKLRGRIGKVLRYCNKAARIILERYLKEKKYSRETIANFYRDYLRSELSDINLRRSPEKTKKLQMLLTNLQRQTNLQFDRKLGVVEK